MTPRWYRDLNGNARRAFWTTYAGFGLDAMDVQLYAFIMPALLALWSLSHAQAGLLASVTLACSALGGWAAGTLADRFGRVRVLTITILWLGVSSCLCGLAQNFGQLLIARALQGLGFGAEWAAGAVFVAEVVSPEVRGRVVGTVQSAWALGWGLAASISAMALALLPAEWGWRVTFLVGLPPMIAIFLVRVRLHDPAMFLAERRKTPWTAIFGGGRLSTTLRGSLLATGMHGGYWSIATWWPAMLHAERGFSTATAGAYFGVIVAGSLFGYLAGAWLGDVAGRRATLAGFALGGAVTVLACTASPVSDMALLILSFPLGFFALGMFSAIGPVLSELFPTRMRGSGLGFCYNVGRGLAGGMPVLIGLRVETMGLAHAIGLYATSAYVVVLAAVALIPETRGQDLAGHGRDLNR
ncbi:MAG: MFS transporter [Caulobacter sp.]|nr:MFS transporter [Caulobacter sp.]